MSYLDGLPQSLLFTPAVEPVAERPTPTARAAWLEMWPNHCRTCRGRGRYIPNDEDEDGFGCGCIPRFKHCPGCTAHGICARCGQSSLGDEDGPCNSCGWDYNDSLPASFL